MTCRTERSFRLGRSCASSGRVALAVVGLHCDPAPLQPQGRIRVSFADGHSPTLDPGASTREGQATSGRREPAHPMTHPDHNQGHRGPDMPNRRTGTPPIRRFDHGPQLVRSVPEPNQHLPTNPTSKIAGQSRRPIATNDTRSSQTPRTTILKTVVVHATVGSNPTPTAGQALSRWSCRLSLSRMVRSWSAAAFAPASMPFATVSRSSGNRCPYRSSVSMAVLWPSIR